jgi:hypothetical protein
MLKIAERDRYVLQTCKDYGIPVMCSIGGSYLSEIKTIETSITPIS